MSTTKTIVLNSANYTHCQ